METTISQKKFAAASWILSAGILLILLFAATKHEMGGYGVETDFYWAYAPDAQRLLNGEMPKEPGVGPVYSLTLAAINLALDDWFVSGRTLSLISTVLCGLFTFGFLKSVFNARLAFYTLVLWFAVVMNWALVASTDMFFAMLVASSVFLLYRHGEFSNRNLLFSGLAMGVCYLTRHNAIVLPLGVALILLFLNPDAEALAPRLKKIGLFAAAFILINIPWSLIQMFASGSPLRSDSYLIIASHFYGRSGVVSSEDMRQSAQQFNSLWSVISYDFIHFVKHYIKNLYRHFNDLMLHSAQFPAFLFVVAGMLMAFPGMSKRQLSLFVFPSISFLLLCLVHYEPRYYLYILSFFLLFVPYFLFTFAVPANGLAILKRWRFVAQGIVFAFTVVFALNFSVKEIRESIASEPRELIEIAAEFKRKGIDGRTIIARKPHFGFLTNLETVYFPEANSIEMLLAFARDEGADFLLYGEMESERRPELQKLLEPDSAPPQLQVVTVWQQPKTVLYRLNFAPSDGAQTGG